MIACYVSGAGMFAGASTHRFKIAVMLWLEASGTGYDTRFQYYRAKFPALTPAQLARRVCDPIEHHDTDWVSQPDCSKHAANLTRFVCERDARFRADARAAIYCFDEAGLGTGINVMRFLQERKAVLGFYAADSAERRVNLTNVLQLEAEFPDRVRLAPYDTVETVTARLKEWLPLVANGKTG